MQLISRDKEQAEQMSASIELVANLTQRYLAVESVYFEHQTGKGIAILQARIILLYKRVLQFQVQVVKSKLSSISRGIRPVAQVAICSAPRPGQI